MQNLLRLYRCDPWKKPDVFTKLPVFLMQLMSEVTADTHTHTRSHFVQKNPRCRGESVGVALSIIKACPTQQAHTQTHTHIRLLPVRAGVQWKQTQTFSLMHHLPFSLTLSFFIFYFKHSPLFLLPHPLPLSCLSPPPLLQSRISPETTHVNKAALHLFKETWQSDLTFTLNTHLGNISPFQCNRRMRLRNYTCTCLTRGGPLNGTMTLLFK